MANKKKSAFIAPELASEPKPESPQSESPQSESPQIAGLSNDQIKELLLAELAKQAKPKPSPESPQSELFSLSEKIALKAEKKADALDFDYMQKRIDANSESLSKCMIKLAAIELAIAELRLASNANHDQLISDKIELAKKEIYGALLPILQNFADKQ